MSSDPPARASSDSAKPPPALARVLLVEDHADTARVMVRLLSREGYEVRTAAGVASGLEVAREFSFDLLISDIGLPDGTGLELMEKLRAERGGAPVKGIALTGFGMEDDLRKSKDVGFVQHLTKPIDFQKLQSAIREVMG